MVETSASQFAQNKSESEKLKQSSSLVTATIRNVSACNTDDHYNPSVRMLQILKLSNGSCGFHLSRSKWDPYPWVSRVDKESPAEVTGLKVGDCVLEVNSEDVLGMRIVEIANMVRSKPDQVSLLLWSTGLDPSCNPESLCCGPMPQNLERLSASMSTILAAMECPICMDTIPPPILQCVLGHIICARCRSRSEKCPVCREKYSPGRSLIAEQVYNSLTEAFNLQEDTEGKLRERLFGAKCIKTSELRRGGDGDFLKPAQSHTQKFLAKLMGKATSMDNLSTKKDTTSTDDFNKMSFKAKSLSLSSSEIFRPEAISVIRCPSANRLPTTELSSSQGNLLGTRRPVSCHTSTESLDRIVGESESDDIVVVQLTIPQIHKPHFKCPCGCDDCNNLLKSADLVKHVTELHEIPVVTFGTASAKISLPPRTPIENAFLLLLLNGKEFWLRLDTRNGDLFLSALIQAGEAECDKYLLEVAIKNVVSDKIMQRELITRTNVHSLATYSWPESVRSRMGVFYSKESISSTFNLNEEILLTASIKSLSET